MCMYYAEKNSFKIFLKYSLFIQKVTAFTYTCFKLLLQVEPQTKNLIWTEGPLEFRVYRKLQEETIRYMYEKINYLPTWVKLIVKVFRLRKRGKEIGLRESSLNTTGSSEVLGHPELFFYIFIVTDCAVPPVSHSAGDALHGGRGGAGSTHSLLSLCLPWCLTRETLPGHLLSRRNKKATNDNLKIQLLGKHPTILGEKRKKPRLWTIYKPQIMKTLYVKLCDEAKTVPKENTWF